MKITKRLISIIGGIALFVALITSNVVFASETMDTCAEHIHYTGELFEANDLEYTQKEELVIEVASEAETFTYPIDPNYRYTFVWSTPSLARAVCYNCGKSTMSTVTRKSEWGTDYLQCPLSYGAGLENDYFTTWYHYMRERCTACGYNSEEWFDRKSYTAICSNYDPMYTQVWEVREEYTMAAGYDPHQSLRWWLYKEMV